jgi:hypothetical protein
VSAVIHGTNLSNAVSVTFGGPGVSAVIVPGGTSTNLGITITIAANAAVGPQTVTVTTQGGQSQAFSSFFVANNSDLRPLINPLNAANAGLSRSVAAYFGSSSISPEAGYSDTTLAVTLTGSNFIAGATTVDAGPLITISNVTVTGPGTLLVNFTIDPAALGTQDATVTTSAGTSAPISFTVN